MCALHLLGTLVLLAWPQPGLAWRAEAWLQRPWTLWSSAWLHGNAGHATGNLLALGAVALLGIGLRLPAAAAWAWGLAWPLSVLGLLAWPQVLHYVGLSGLLHAGLAVAWVFQCGARGGGRLIGAALLAGLALKLMQEHAWNAPLQAAGPLEMTVVNAAHLSGALAGLTSAAGWRLAAYLVHQRCRGIAADQ